MRNRICNICGKVCLPFGITSHRRWHDLPEYKDFQNKWKNIMHEVLTKRHPMKGKTHTIEVKERIRRSHIGVKRPRQALLMTGRKHRLDSKIFSEEHRQRSREHMIRLRKAGKFNITPNTNERVLDYLLQEIWLPFRYVGNNKTFIESYNPDFVSENLKLIIEIFGDYWHNLDKIKERDERRLRIYQQYGYKTLIVWEHEFKDIKAVINKIREFYLSNLVSSEGEKFLEMIEK